jgi:hypothetical protein
MKVHSAGFKLAFMLLAAALTIWGCKTPPRSEQLQATLSLHLEVPPDRGEKGVAVPITRENPFFINVHMVPFLDERYLTNVVLYSAMGGPAIDLTFGTTGARLLEQYSLDQRGRQFAIFCSWGDGKSNKIGRWLAAPVFTRTINDGHIRFSPDASPEETEEIVTALTNTVKKVRKTTGL